MLLGRETAKQLRKFGSVLTLGIEMGVSVAVGYFGARYLAAKFEIGPWFQWVGLAFGIAAAFKSLYTVARKTREELSSHHTDPEE